MLDHRNLTSGSVHSHTVKAYSYSDLALAMIAMLNNPVYILQVRGVGMKGEDSAVDICMKITVLQPLKIHNL